MHHHCVPKDLKYFNDDMIWWLASFIRKHTLYSVTYLHSFVKFIRWYNLYLRFMMHLWVLDQTFFTFYKDQRTAEVSRNVKYVSMTEGLKDKKCNEMYSLGAISTDINCIFFKLSLAVPFEQWKCAIWSSCFS